jgi:hypothetical protein
MKALRPVKSQTVSEHHGLTTYKAEVNIKVDLKETGYWAVD